MTNLNWENFWLNEGFCVFIERKLIGLLRGESEQQFHSILGWNSLRKSVDHFGENHPFTSLNPSLTDADPDDAFSSIPYEKGSALLFYLEKLLGGPVVFDAFLRAYFNHFAHQSVVRWLESDIFFRFPPLIGKNFFMFTLTANVCSWML